MASCSAPHIKAASQKERVGSIAVSRGGSDTNKTGESVQELEYMNK